MSELPKGWVQATLLEIAGPKGVVTDGDWVESKDQDPKGEIRLTQLADIGDGTFLNRSARFMNRISAERLGCTYLREGDLLIARMPDPLGRACIFPGVGQPAVTAVDVFIWRPDDLGADARCMMYFINSPDLRTKIQSEAGGTTRQRVAGGKLKGLILSVPPLGEQRRIVTKLDRMLARLDRVRSGLGQIDTLIKHYKQGLLEIAFSGQLTSEWREAKGVPSAEFVEVGSLVTDIRYGTAQKCYSEPKGVAVLRIPNVSSGRIDLTDLKYAELPSGDFDRLRLVAGDVLVVRSNGSADLVGRPALVTETEAGLAYAGYLIRLRPDFSKVVPRYLALMLEAPQMRHVIEVGARSTSGVHNVNSVELAALRIAQPEISEQNEIVRRLSVAFDWVDKIATEHARAARYLPRLVDAILSKAFRGQLVPQDSADEPASELLKRIHTAGIENPKQGRGRSARNITTPRIPREKAAMTKSRQDNDVKEKPYLADLLKDIGRRASIEELFKRSELPLTDFYKQLAWEVDAGHIRNDDKRLEAA